MSRVVIVIEQFSPVVELFSGMVIDRVTGKATRLHIRLYPLSNLMEIVVPDLKGRSLTIWFRSPNGTTILHEEVAKSNSLAMPADSFLLYLSECKGVEIRIDID